MGAAQPPTAELPSLSPSPGVPGADGAGTLPGGTGCCVPSSPLGVSLSGQAPSQAASKAPAATCRRGPGSRVLQCQQGRATNPVFPSALAQALEPSLRRNAFQHLLQCPILYLLPHPGLALGHTARQTDAFPRGRHLHPSPGLLCSTPRATWSFLEHASGTRPLLSWQDTGTLPGPFRHRPPWPPW